MTLFADVPRVPHERIARPPIPLAIGPLTIGLDCDDRASAAWLIECLDPWFVRSQAAAGPRVTVTRSARAYAKLVELRPRETAVRTCFVLDQQVVSLPARPTADGVVLADARRACFLIVDPSGITLVGDPASLRWRFTLQLVFLEIAATRFRRTELDVHAAAVEARGRGLLIAGPKRAGKTTLSLHLLRSGHCRWIANDRAFAGRAGDAFLVRGMPAAVKVQPATLRTFPELCRAIGHVARPYLHSLEELARAGGSPEPRDDSTELAFSPAQLAKRLAVKALASAPLGAIVFPEIRGDVEGFAVERLDSEEVAATVRANLYGKSTELRNATLFEEMDGGRSTVPPGLAEAIAGSVPGYRILLGPGAYAVPGFAAQVLDTLLP